MATVVKVPVQLQAMFATAPAVRVSPAVGIGHGDDVGGGRAAAGGGRGVDHPVTGVTVPAGARLDVDDVLGGAAQPLADLGRGEGGVARLDEGGHARGVRSGAGSSVEPLAVVAAVVARRTQKVGRGQDGRSDEVHRGGRALGGGAVVRAPPALTVAGVAVGIGAHAGVDFGAAARGTLAVAARGGGADGDHVSVDRGIADRRGVLVAGGRQQGDARVVGVLQGGVGGRIAADGRTQAHAGDLGAVVRGVVQRVLDRREVHRTGAVGDLQRHDAAAAGDAGGAQAVVDHRGGHAGAGGAVAGARGVVVGVGVAVAEIVAGHLAQVGMARLDAAVDDGDHDAAVAVALGVVPGGVGVGVEAERAHGRAGLVGVRGPVVAEQLDGVVVAPVQIVHRVARHRRGEGPPVDGGLGHARIGREAARHGGRIAGSVGLQHVPQIQPELVGQVGPLGGHPGPGDLLDPGAVAQRVDGGDSRTTVGNKGALGAADVQAAACEGFGLELDEDPLGVIRQDGVRSGGEPLLDRNERPGGGRFEGPGAACGQDQGGQDQSQAHGAQAR